ncbi:MAG: ATP-binding protein, partial [Bacteroidota bacterium]
MEIAGKRIIRTIELILNSADVQSGTYLNTPTKTDIYTEVLEKLFSYFQPYAREKKLQFVMIKNTVNTIATVDAYSVEQVFDNLIDNAIKFTDSGKIVIETNTNQEENLIVSIEDTGVGISDEYMNSLFSFFSQEDQSYTRSYEGNGLGLALTKRLCDLNKIKLDLETQKGIGTKFKLTFPNDK